MKHALITIGLILALAVSAGAQDDKTGLTAKGFKFGLNSSKFAGDDASFLDSKTGFAAGGFLTFSLSPELAIQPEVLYTAKGAKIEESIGSISGTAKFNVNYIEIPLLLKYSIPTTGSVKPSLYAGPAIGVLASANLDLSASTPLGDAGVDFDIKDAFKSTDLGIVVGGGLGYQSGQTMFTFDFRFTMGMSKIIDVSGWNDLIAELDFEDLFDPTDLLLEEPDTKNSNMSFLIGMSF
jgi:hypothetical protein